MKELIEKIKELESNAKEAQYYKDRYETLRAETKQALFKLSELLAERIPTAKRKYGKSTTIDHNKIADILYKRMMQDSEVTSKDIIKELEADGMNPHSQNIQTVRDILSKKEGVDFRREANNKVYFYTEAKKKDSEIKFEKTSFMG